MCGLPPSPLRTRTQCPMVQVSYYRMGLYCDLPMAYKNDFNLFVGGVTGTLKGIKINDGKIIDKNLQSVKVLKPGSEITAMNWGDEEEVDILVGTATQQVKIYDSEFKAYSSSIETTFGTGPIVGITRFGGAVTTCSESGHIKVWKYKKTEQVELETHFNVSRMRAAHINSDILATGGQNNNLKLWNLETKEKIFNARNIKKDELELEAPVWITDMVFLPESECRVAVSTRHGQVQLFDTKAQKRPVISMQLPNHSFTTISLSCHDSQVLLGSTTGNIILADLRSSNIIHAFKGATGAIRGVYCHPFQPYISSVGLDRYLRIHHFKTKKVLHQVYLKTKLNCVLMRSNFNELEDHKKEESAESEVECIDVESDEEYNKIFQNMETVNEREKNDVLKKKRKVE